MHNLSYAYSYQDENQTANFVSMTIMAEVQREPGAMDLHEAIRRSLHCGRSLPIMQRFSGWTRHCLASVSPALILIGLSDPVIIAERNLRVAVILAISIRRGGVSCVAGVCPASED